MIDMVDNFERAALAAALAAERAKRHHEEARDAPTAMEALVHALFAIEARLEEQSWRTAELIEITG